MKRIVSLSLALIMIIGLLAGCGGGKPAAGKTPEELTVLYKEAIEGARDAELNEAFAVMNSFEDETAEFVLPMVGISSENATAYAASISMMMVHAYGIVAVMPAEGKTEEVTAGLQGFIDLQQQNFEMYLADQYDIACAARLETLEDGTVLMVMCADQDTVFESIKAAILA